MMEKMLFEYYESHWIQIKRCYWGDQYANRHRELIDKVNEYAKELGVELDQAKFRSVERDFS
jgi:hypothetical protein